MANDLSFNIVALDQAGATFIRLADQVDKLSEKLDRLDHKDVTANVNIKTDDSTKALDSFTNRFALLTAGIVAASPLAGAAIVGGIGAGFIAAAAAAEKSNQDVQASYKGLWADVVLTTKTGADQIVPQIVGAANSMDATVQKLGPDIGRAFSFAGPDIVALTRGVDQLAQNSMPGITTAMANSLPVFQGTATAAGQLGTDVSTALTSISQHATEYGTFITTVGQITGTVVTGVVSLVNDMAVVWSQNGAVIVSDVRQIVGVITDLGQGALPIVSGALRVVAESVNAVVTVIGPLAPLLGTVGGVAATTWAAFKVSELATSGVKSLATGVVDLAGNLESGAVKAAGYAASMLGVEAESSAAAGAITTAGAAAATAGTEIGIGLTALAGPIGIVAGLAAGALALGAAFIHTGGDTVQLTGSMDDLTSALERSHGAFDQAATDALKASPDFKAVAKSASDFGISSTDLANALQGQGSSIDQVRAKLQGIVEAHTHVVDVSGRAGAETGRVTNELDAQGKAAQGVIDSLGPLASEYQKSTADAAAATASQNAAATATANSAQYQQAATGIAGLFGMSLNDVTAGFAGIIASNPSASLAEVVTGFEKVNLAVVQAASSMQNEFAQADKQVVQAQQSVADTNHSVEQSTRSVADAQQGVVSAAHSLEQAQRGLQDAYAGVATAEQNYAKAQDSERQAEVALHTARQQAIQDLKDLHLQLEDQVLSEEQARVKLFDAQATSAGSGVTLDNARQIAAQQVTAANESQIKVAFDLISAQNSLNDSLNTGDKLRTQVAAADRAGVEGAQGVISAEAALRNAQDQVTASAQALQRAHQQVADAQYGVQQASLALAKAHQGVTDAEYQEQRAADALRVAQQNLAAAQDSASRSLDQHTAAGQRNLGMITSLWDAITKSGLPIQEQYKTAIDDVASAFGVSKKQAADMLDTASGTHDFSYSLTAIAGVDASSLQNLIEYGATGHFPNAFRAKGGNLAYATGGPIIGFGGPTDDMVPIMASHGEFMQPADSVAYYGTGFMEALRQKRVPRGWDGAAAPGYATGGLIAEAAGGAGVYSAAYQSVVNALTAQGLPHPAPLPAYVPPTAGMIAYSGGGGVTQWEPLILQALAALGQSPGWLGTVERRMNQESGGNPNAINLYDSNAQRGDPSRGLMQTIGSTFAAYRNPAWSPNIFDPLANIYAGLNYAIHRYGSLDALNRPGGYDSGGWLLPGGVGVNNLAQPEAVLTPEESVAHKQLASAAAKGKLGNVTHYHLTVYNAANNEIDLRAQFQRMEIAAGML